METFTRPVSKLFHFLEQSIQLYKFTIVHGAGAHIITNIIILKALPNLIVCKK